MFLNMKRFALASGTLGGLAMLLLTLVAVGRGVGKSLGHLDGIYIGYEVSYMGSVIGLLYGFVSGLIAGSLFAFIYNGSMRAKT
jgi:hypothetical protein